MANGKRPAVVEVQDLVIAYGDFTAVNGISLEIYGGETFALLGPNGAGKTSTIEILEGYRKRTSGHVSVLGYDPGRNKKAFRERIGLVLQSTALEPELTIYETVTAFAQFYRDNLPIDELLETIGLYEQRGQRVRTLSGGQQRRLEIALSIVGDPDLIFLDEPTTGLDPEGRAGVWNLIRLLSDSGKTVILSSHHMEEVEALAHRLAIMVSGQIRAAGHVSDLLHQYSRYSRFSFYWPHRDPPHDLPTTLFMLPTRHDNWISYSVGEPARAIAQLTAWARPNGIDLNSLTITKPTLEDIYMALTNDMQPQGRARR